MKKEEKIFERAFTNYVDMKAPSRFDFGNSPLLITELYLSDC